MKLTSPNKALLAGVSGTVLQWYDFAIFVYFAPIIAATYFPSGNSLASLLNTFSVFAVGYLMAPLGSVLFGYIGDRYGRKKALTFSILAMGVSTALISIVPSYDYIGVSAPILITLLRVIQGFVGSSEFTGSAIFLVEHAKPEKKAFYGCLTSSAYSLGSILAGIVASLLTAAFMPWHDPSILDTKERYNDVIGGINNEWKAVYRRVQIRSNQASHRTWL